MKIQWISMFVLVYLVMFLFPLFAEGHSYLELSSPSPDSTLEEPPTGIWVQFSEPIDTDLSKLRLEKADGEVIEGEQYSVDNSSMTLRLPPLENGEYDVYWQILSLDTHVTDGSFRFFVEAELPKEIEVEEPVVIEEAEEERNEEGNQEQVIEQEGQPGWSIFSRINTGLRILDILTVTVMGGWLFFQGILWRKDGERFLVRKASKRLIERWMYFLAFFLFISTSFGHMASRAIHLTQTTLWDPILWQTMWVLLLSTTIGTVSLVKPLIVAMLIALVFSSKERLFSKWLLLIALLVTFGYTGHAYHSEKILLHTLHMLALIVWFGGVVGFVVYSFFIRKDQESLQYMHRKLKVFSRIALCMVGVVAVSGVILGDVYLESWNDLLVSEYGQILLWKISLFSFIILIAACHRFIWLPRLNKADSGEEKSKQLEYLVCGLRLELVLVVVVLVIAGMLSTASPPADIHGDHHYYYH